MLEAGATKFGDDVYFYPSPAAEAREYNSEIPKGLKWEDRDLSSLFFQVSDDLHTMALVMHETGGSLTHVSESNFRRLHSLLGLFIRFVEEKANRFEALSNLTEACTHGYVSIGALAQSEEFGKIAQFKRTPRADVRAEEKAVAHVATAQRGSRKKGSKRG
jgi:hypothetical protein